MNITPFALAQRYLAITDAALPSRITALYLTGSVALDDYVPGQSDVDFVAVTSSGLTHAECDRLEEVHVALVEPAAPHFDGIYVTPDDLRSDPTTVRTGAFVLEGRFTRGESFEANPPTWLILHDHPLPVRGPARPQVFHDRAVLERWTRQNLQTYWRDQLERLDRGRAALRRDRDRLNRAIAWSVPGVARLHHTLATGTNTSKTGACRYALEQFPRWKDLIYEALALRAGRAIATREPAVRLADLVAYMETVITSALAES